MLLSTWQDVHTNFRQYHFQDYYILLVSRSNQGDFGLWTIYFRGDYKMLLSIAHKDNSNFTKNISGVEYTFFYPSSFGSESIFTPGQWNRKFFFQDKKSTTLSLNNVFFGVQNTLILSISPKRNFIFRQLFSGQQFKTLLLNTRERSSIFRLFLPGI